MNPATTSWLRLLQTSHLSDPSYAFQRFFSSLPHQQLNIIQAWFSKIPGGMLTCPEFVTIALTIWAVQDGIGHDGQIDKGALLKMLDARLALNKERTCSRNMIMSRLRGLILTFQEMDLEHTGFISWQDFSTFLSTLSAPSLSVSDKHVYTMYDQRIKSSYLLSSKVSDPIQYVGYSKEADVFMVCCKDCKIYLLDSRTMVRVGSLQGHRALPVAAASFKPSAPGINYGETEYHQPGKRTIGGFNYVTSGSDRKLIIWNGLTNRPIDLLPTENMHTVIKTTDELMYRRACFSPAIFSGDDHGYVYFWKLSNQTLNQPAAPLKTLMSIPNANQYGNVLLREAYSSAIPESGGMSSAQLLHRSTLSRTPSLSVNPGTILTRGRGTDRRKSTVAMKEDVENIVLFYESKRLNGLQPFAEGFNASFYLEDSDEWRQESGDVLEDDWMYTEEQDKLFKKSAMKAQSRGLPDLLLQANGEFHMDENPIGFNGEANPNEPVVRTFELSGTDISDEEKSGGTDVEAEKSRNIHHNFQNNRRRQEYVQITTREAAQQGFSSTPIWSVKGHDGWVNCMCLERMLDTDVPLLATGGTEGGISIYDIERSLVKSSFRHHREAITGISWLHHRGLLAACSLDHQVSFWSFGSSGNRPVSTISGSDSPYVGIYAHYQKNEFVTVEANGKVKVFDVRKMEPIQTLLNPNPRTGKIVSAAYNDNTGFLAMAGRTINHVVPINEENTQRCSTTPITMWCFSPTAPFALLMCVDGLQLWDMLYGKLLKTNRSMFQSESDTTLRTEPREKMAAKAVINSVAPAESFSRNAYYQDLQQMRTKALGCIETRLNNGDEVSVLLQHDTNIFNTDVFGAASLKGLSLKDLRDLHAQEGRVVKGIERAGQGTVSFGLECCSLALSPDNTLYAVSISDGRILLHDKMTDNIAQDLTDAGKLTDKHENAHLADGEIDCCTTLFISERLTPLCMHHYGHTLNHTPMGGEQPQVGMQDANGPAGGSNTISTQEREITPLIVWLFFRQTQRLLTLKLSRDEAKPHGRLFMRTQWKDVSLCHDLNVAYVYTDQDMTCINSEGGAVSKLTFSVDGPTELHVAIKYVITPGWKLQYVYLTCGLMLILHMMTCTLLAILPIPDGPAVVSFNCIEESKRMLIVYGSGQLTFIDLTEVYKLCALFEEALVLTPTKELNLSIFTPSMHTVYRIPLIPLDTDHSSLVPVQSSSPVRVSRGKKRSSNQRTRQMTEYLLQIDATALLRKQYFTVMDVPLSFRPAFPDVSQDIWNAVDMGAKGEIPSDGSGNDTLNSWYRGDPIIIHPHILSEINSIPLTLDMTMMDVIFAENDEPTVPSHFSTPLSSFNIVGALAVRTVGLFLCSCATGHVLAFDAETTCFLSTMVHRGWPIRMRKYLRGNLTSMKLNKTQELYTKRMLEMQTQTLQFGDRVYSSLKNAIINDLPETPVDESILISNRSRYMAETLTNICLADIRKSAYTISTGTGVEQPLTDYASVDAPKLLASQILELEAEVETDYQHRTQDSPMRVPAFSHSPLRDSCIINLVSEQKETELSRGSASSRLTGSSTQVPERATSLTPSTALISPSRSKSQLSQILTASTLRKTNPILARKRPPPQRNASDETQSLHQKETADILIMGRQDITAFYSKQKLQPRSSYIDFSILQK
ncbi:WD40 repeat protein [Giardia muris]|uniref:WD40 repeat protein n=1 Tax=Giardia muris TaxID=5742 RepID=A0A4Z1SWY1_GIAMU|nr:WD40 repeat protein [Giardia muris]|eukprot:TNJ30254.1 WD40 repeat protein [Giardia muris]